jgi:hypothetical protein
MSLMRCEVCERVFDTDWVAEEAPDDTGVCTQCRDDEQEEET